MLKGCAAFALCTRMGLWTPAQVQMCCATWTCPVGFRPSRTRSYAGWTTYDLQLEGLHHTGPAHRASQLGYESQRLRPSSSTYLGCEVVAQRRRHCKGSRDAGTLRKASQTGSTSKCTYEIIPQCAVRGFA